MKYCASAVRTGLVNYESGNLRSVSKALEHCGAGVTMIERPEDFAGIEALVLPGVGAFGDAATSLRRRGLWQPVADWLAADRPFLGICLGYQLLFERSEESPGVDGFGLLPGAVVKFTRAPRRKIPHMGWNTIEPTAAAPGMFAALNTTPYFYFVHSYYPAPADPALVAAWCDYDGRFAAAVARGRLLATQFHPEKSQDNGLRVLANFLAEASR